MRHPREVLRGTADMRADERGGRVPATIALRPSISPSKGGNPRLESRAVGRRSANRGVPSSSQRSLVSSSGSKNAIGSATWIITGTSSSPAASQSGIEARVIDRRPAPVAGRGHAGPSLFQIFSPGAPRPPGPAACPPPISPNRYPFVAQCAQSNPRRPRRVPAALACQRRDARQDVLAPAAVEVHDRGHAGRVQGALSLPPSGPAHSPPKGTPRWLWASMTGTADARCAAGERGPLAGDELARPGRCGRVSRVSRVGRFGRRSPLIP